MVNWKQVFKNYWYIIIATILSILITILLILSWKNIKIPPKVTSFYNSTGYVTDVTVSTIGTETSQSIYCPPNTSLVPMRTTKQTPITSLTQQVIPPPPYLQICLTVPDMISEKDYVVVDIKFQSFLSSSDDWADYLSRCCGQNATQTCQWSPALTYNETSFSPDSAGKIPTCLSNKMGLCVKKMLYSDAQKDPSIKILKNGDLQIWFSQPPQPVCGTSVDFSPTSTVNLQNLCTGQGIDNVFLCRKKM